MADRLKFKGRKQSVRGITGMVFGILALLAAIVMIILNGIYYVNTEILYGIIGVVCFFMSVAGFILGLMAIKERDVFPKIPVTSIVLNSISLIVYIVIYIFGIS